MGRIELNHWFSKENELGISLLNFYVKIRILHNDQFIYFETTVKEDVDKKKTFDFYSLEDAISFTEQEVSKCYNIQEVVGRYQKMFENDEFKSAYSIGKYNDSIIDLTPDKVEQAIIGYFGEENTNRVLIDHELTLCQDQLNIEFYLIEQINHDGIEEEVKTILENEDLKIALNDYIGFDNYELIDFKFIGGVHKAGYFFNEDIPHYDGIELKVKEKAKTLSKKSS